ncbi:MAG: hypothetical protein JNL36_01885 [Candidatus Kapabacteria bacterium]|nr:hypothetical protein [Candidatus Kapabacteria bacterium]
MKTLNFILVAVFAVLSFGCHEVITESEIPKEQLGMLNHYDNFHTSNTIRLGDVYNDSISCWRFDDCVKRTYFKVSQVKEYHYLFVLYDYSESFKCSGIPIVEKIAYQCSPTQTGVYTLEFKDRHKSFFKKLIVR